MAHSMPPERKRAAIYIVLIFLCGALTGVAATNVWINGWPWGTSASADSFPHSTQHTVQKFTRELSLTPEQAKQLNQILDETHGMYRALEDQQEAIREKGRTRIREILTEEQRPKYEQLLAKIVARRNRQHR